MSLTLLTLNVGAPSLDRARRQLRWLHEQNADVLVLTETKATAGSTAIAEAFTQGGHTVVFPEHAPGELGVMIVSRVGCRVDALGAAMTHLPARAAGVVVDTDRGPIRVLGAYVPSRDKTQEKTDRKRRWIEGFHQALQTTDDGTERVLLGDLNVLEPDHRPRHTGQFAPFEYDFYRDLTHRHGLIDLYRHLHPDRIEHSWARRAELGYRYDHVYLSPALVDQVQACGYDHGTRAEPQDGTAKLTDHSALSVTLAATGPLLASARAVADLACPQPEPEPMLF